MNHINLNWLIPIFPQNSIQRMQCTNHSHVNFNKKRHWEKFWVIIDSSIFIISLWIIYYHSVTQVKNIWIALSIWSFLNRCVRINNIQNCLGFKFSNKILRICKKKKTRLWEKIWVIIRLFRCIVLIAIKITLPIFFKK